MTSTSPSSFAPIFTPAPYLAPAPATAMARALQRQAVGGSEAGERSRFGARFGAELANRRSQVIAASLATVLTPVALVTTAFARPHLGTDHAAVPAPPPPAAAKAPGDAGPAASAALVSSWTGDDWIHHAERAAATCPGLPPEVLVAIGHVETRFGKAEGPSSAGALGPMQFLPATWSHYGVDADGDGRANVMNPVDALHGAAQLMCANGGGDPDRLRSALWNYNHSPAYVDEVLRVARTTARLN